ncbi:RsmD family RNA methyltransferase [Phaeocystidibacter marisrubri]|uniref:Methyltransferase domain-containing protein n=1 Tax=Phaeocystidibacter marisrubri TaxID=1577780 RepID=A0A6L3ZCW3_9FLAO|nr:RsmD family RNA methyltransferase [Phaeocystidibacter marisrubri]KAB2815695.1 methyltransferase domain-containing protein [Phaeocystidibacter marisrubri]GGH65227.1 methyltransferase [Phaeocystidibacter marisrubri]
MRIISGRHRGKIIKAPAKLPVRPTTDIAKESLFNILMNWYNLNEVEVLDLFAGTGNLSYEFVSRGARKVVAVDINPGCTKFIEKTAEQLGYSEIEVLKGDALKFAQRTLNKYDIVIADPPYEWEGHHELIEAVLSKGLLRKGGVFVLEHGMENDFSDHPDLLDTRKYGSVHFAIFGEESEN